MQQTKSPEGMVSGRSWCGLHRLVSSWAARGTLLSTGGALLIAGCALEPRYIEVPVYVDADADGRTDVESPDGSGDAPVRAEVGQSCSAGDCGPDLECTAGRCAPPGFAFIPAGTFWQGAPADAALAFARDNEMPLRPVTLTHDYLMGIDPVTDGLWEDVIGPPPSEWTQCGSDCPVVTLNWYDALWATNALSILNGLQPCYRLEECSGVAGSGCTQPSECAQAFECGVVELVSEQCDGFRLPTEAEYERAARAGDDAYVVGMPLLNEESVGAVCRHRSNSMVSWDIAADCGDEGRRVPCGPAPVNTQAVNAWGVRGWMGNVWMWMWDGWDPRAYGEPGLVNPVGRRLDGRRAMRGPSFSDGWQDCRVSVRGRTDARDRFGNHGFRVMRRLDPVGPPRVALCEEVTLPGPRCPVLVQDEVGGSPTTLCGAAGGRVFRINDERENEYLGRTFGRRRPAIDARVQDDEWRAISGATLQYQRTSDIVGGATAGECARLLQDGRWEADDCARTTVALCEMEPASP